MKPGSKLKETGGRRCLMKSENSSLQMKCRPGSLLFEPEAVCRQFRQNSSLEVFVPPSSYRVGLESAQLLKSYMAGRL